MPENLVSQDVAFALAIFLGYVLLVIVVGARRGLRRHEPLVFAIYLVFAAIWFLCVTQARLRAIAPTILWDLVATMLLVGLGILFWDFTRAFLRQPILPIGGWLSAALVIVALLVLDYGVVTLPPFALSIGAFTLTERTVTTALLGAIVALLYGGIAIMITFVEFARQPSPLHRNRIKFWVPAAVMLIAGSALVWTAQAELAVIGIAVHWLGAVLIAYLVVQFELPDIATAIRRALNYLFASLIPVVIAIAVSVGIVYLLSQSPAFRLQLTDDVVIGIVVASIVLFILFQPLSGMMRRVMGRLLFGRGFRSQQVVREYGQAVSQIISLDSLTATAMQIIDDALGIQRGTLLVVEETRESGWRLRVIVGRGVASDQPPLLLRIGSPPTKWLVEKGAPLHQYTIDVDPQFESLSAAERAEWRQLGMEVFLPIKRSGALIGLMALGRRRSGRAYTSRELALLTTLADQTAVALENASLFDRVQRRAEQLALLNEIGRVITTSLDLEPAIGLIAERIEKTFKGAMGFIFLADETARELVLQSAFGREMQLPFRVPMGKGLVGSVVVEGKPVLVPDLPRDSRYAEEVEGALCAGAESALCVPVIARDKTIGVILVAESSRTDLGMTELSLLDSIAAFASIAIENARQVAAREAQLRSQIQMLRIEIDEAKKARQVEEITETEYFQQLQERARELKKTKELGTDFAHET
jgi:GAF domain-containing protein